MINVFHGSLLLLLESRADRERRKALESSGWVLLMGVLNKVRETGMKMEDVCINQNEQDKSDGRCPTNALQLI